MPSLDPRFVLIQPLQDIFFDKDLGIPLSAGTVAFYEDNDRTVLKPVYELSETPNNDFVYNVLPNPLQLSSIGTFVDEMGNDIVPYFFPYQGTPENTTGIIDLYFIQVFSSGGVFQFSRQAWPNVTPASIIGDNVALSDNILSNSQFSVVSFNASTPAPGYVYTVSGTNTVNQLAPDWTIVTNGSGTVTVQQIATLNTEIPSNPPYVIEISSTGLTGPLQLIQTLNHDPRILQGQFVSGSFVAASEDGAVHNIMMSYVPSDGGANYELVNVTIPTNGFFEYNGAAVEINGTPNPDSATTGFVQIIITIPQGANIQISSIQVVPVPSANATAGYIEETTQRQLDHLFHYYANELLIKPKSSILVGWDFALNPWQIYSPTLTTITSACSYITDQTILWQASTSAVNAGQASIANRNCLEIQANSSSSNQFAIIQYIDPTSTLSYWSYILSSLARMRLFTTNGTTVGVKMRLIYSASLPSALSSTEPITSLSGSSIVFSSNWTTLVPLNDPTYNLPNAYDTIESPNGDAFPDFTFDAFQLPVATASTMTLGIVLYTTSVINNAGTPDSIVFDSVSLVPNRFAVVTSPKTYDMTLRECQFYLETSYPVETIPGSASTIDFIQMRQDCFINSGAGTISLTPSAFTIQFFELKRKVVNAGSCLFYLPAGSASGNILGHVINNNSLVNSANLASTIWTTSSTGQKSINFIGNAGAQVTFSVAASSPYALIQFNYVADVRLGVNS